MREHLIHKRLDVGLTHFFEANKDLVPNGAVERIDQKVDIEMGGKKILFLSPAECVCNQLNTGRIDRLFHTLVQLRVAVRFRQNADSCLSAIGSAEDLAKGEQ